MCLKGKFKSYSKSKLKNTILELIKLRKKKWFLFIFFKNHFAFAVLVSYDHDNREHSQNDFFTSNPNLSIQHNHIFSQEYVLASDQIQRKKLMCNIYNFALTNLKVLERKYSILSKNLMNNKPVCGSKTIKLVSWSRPI